MGNSIEETKAEFMADFDRMGEDHVRLRLQNDSFSGTRKTWALEWLAQIERESRLRNEASQAESLEIAKSAKDAAWEAAKAARDAADEARAANDIARTARLIAIVAAIAAAGIPIGVALLG